VQAQLHAGLQAGQWRTARQVAAWLKAAHGIERATKSLLVNDNYSSSQ
jgi:hypothetical protein